MSNIQIKKLHTFLGHNDSLYSLEALDDHRFFSAGSEGMVVLWNLRSPNEGEVVAKVEGSIYAMAYDANANVLFVGENHQGIHKIDLDEQKEVGSVQLGNHQIFDLKMNDGNLWAALESGEIVRLSQNLEVLRREKISSDRVRGLDFYGTCVAASCSDNIVKILNVDTLEFSHELKGHRNSVFTGKYHPSGKYIISGGRDAQLLVWDVIENYILRESLAAHLYTINHLTFSEDGKYFVTCSMDKSIKLWNAHNFKLLKVLDKHRHAGHGNSVNKLLWMKYQDLLVSCSDDRTISVWDINLDE
ncbi:MAG: WD40 repeat domain-containing protein [Cyclobacteriaceae bacterium]